MSSQQQPAPMPRRPASTQAGVWRCGIVGTRKILEGNLPRLRHLVAAPLNFAHAPSYLLTALALGADRLAAQVALSLSIPLSVVMPFPANIYRQDFTTADDLAEFDGLLALTGPNWLALDGSRADPNRAYEAAGRFVVRHADLLIAIWDGEPAQGRGGTADIVRYAAQAGVPVWWVNATEDRPPTWIADPHDLHNATVHGDEAQAALRAYLSTLLTPPPPVHASPHRRLAAFAQIGHHAEPSVARFEARAPPPNPLWRVHAWLMRWAARCDVPTPVATRPDTAAGAYWFDCHQRADARAAAYAARYRSSYVWVVLLGVAALCAGMAQAHAAAPLARTTAAGIELLLLLMIVAIVLAALRYGWHEQFIDDRLLAELCRAQPVLTGFGRVAVPTGGRLNARGGGAVAWVFAAWQRAAPLPTGNTGPAEINAARDALDVLVKQQLAYYDARARVADAAQRRFSRLGTIAFTGLLACVLATLLGAGRSWFEPFALPVDLLATLLPGLSAAAVGLGAYAELQVIADQSRDMTITLKSAGARLARSRQISPDEPLLSQHLGDDASAIVTLLLQELDGWARLFRVKVIETG